MPQIFISYRRAVSAYQARALADRLSAAFGKSHVFLDIDAIPPGETFESYILRRIDTADVFLALLAQGTLDRIHDPDDWVRREIAHALALPQIRIIPVRIDGFLPTPADLPPDLMPLLDRNAVRLEHELFEETADRLIRHIRETEPQGKARPRSRWRLGLMVAGLLIAAVAIGGVFVLMQSGISTPTEDIQTTDDMPTPATEATEAPLTANGQWSPVFETISTIEMARVPAGCFAMGGDEAQNWIGDEWVAAGTGGQQCLPPFYIGRTEITNAQYRACVEAGRCTPPGDSLFYDDPAYSDHPVIGVDWQQANSYAAYIDMRLPTEAEWEYAARGPNGWRYPWGDDYDGVRLNFCDATCALDWRDETVDDGFAQTAPVGSFPDGASWVGALDLGGNVWEWTSSTFWAYPYDAGDGREDPFNSDDQRVVRGGSWFYTLSDARATSRFGVGVAEWGDSLGFRVVLGR